MSDPDQEHGLAQLLWQACPTNAESGRCGRIHRILPFFSHNRHLLTLVQSETKWHQRGTACFFFFFLLKQYLNFVSLKIIKEMSDFSLLSVLSAIVVMLWSPLTSLPDAMQHLNNHSSQRCELNAICYLSRYAFIFITKYGCQSHFEVTPVLDVMVVWFCLTRLFLLLQLFVQRTTSELTALKVYKIKTYDIRNG